MSRYLETHVLLFSWLCFTPQCSQCVGLSSSYPELINNTDVISNLKSISIILVILSIFIIASCSWYKIFPHFIDVYKLLKSGGHLWVNLYMVIHTLREGITHPRWTTQLANTAMPQMFVYGGFFCAGVALWDIRTAGLLVVFVSVCVCICVLFVDICVCALCSIDGVMRTMNTEKLIKTLPIIQNQLDALLDFQVCVCICAHIYVCVRILVCLALSHRMCVCVLMVPKLADQTNYVYIQSLVSDNQLTETCVFSYSICVMTNWTAKQIRHV